MSRDPRNDELRRCTVVTELVGGEWVDSPMTDRLLRRLLRMPWDGDDPVGHKPVSVQAVTAGDMLWFPAPGHADHLYGQSHPWDGPGRHWVPVAGSSRCRGCGHVPGDLPHSQYCLHCDRGEGEPPTRPDTPAPAVPVASKATRRRKRRKRRKERQGAA
jgi:hypothetical protein